MNPNHYLAVAIDYLFRNRPGWRAEAAVGKTLVSSALIDRVAARLGRRLVEVPVGFKWFVDGLLDGSLGFGGEESAGASCPAPRRQRLDHRQGRHPARPAWPARSRRAPGAIRASSTARSPSELGDPVYERIDAPATPEQKERLKHLSPEAVQARGARRGEDRSHAHRARPATARRSAASRW